MKSCVNWFSRWSLRLAVSLLPACSTLAVMVEAPLAVRFVDSATGLAVQPETVAARSLGHDSGEKQWSSADLPIPGRAILTLAPGRHRLTVASANHFPLSAEFEMTPGNPYNVVFHLDPVELPEALRSEVIATLHREGEMLLQGFVADADSGQPLAQVRVWSWPSGRETQTDATGFFRFYIPAVNEGAESSPLVGLWLDKPGYASHQREHLEVWSRGDCTYRLSLTRGDGTVVVDERDWRRRSPDVPESVAAASATDASEAMLPDSTLHHEPSSPTAASPRGERQELGAVYGTESADAGAGTTRPLDAAPPIQAADASAPLIRVPTNIRVLQKDGVTIDYVSLRTYCQRSLPSEWIASWGSLGPGQSGTNSLLAGAVAIRTYAIGYINNPYNANVDICGTTSCQVYNPTAGDSRTTAAANFTANYVMRQPGAARIGYKLTEYSAENNSLGYACGDGYTQPSGGCIYDPVCAGEERYGHGRGICQWGTARWATGRRMRNRSSGDSVTNNYPLQTWVWLCEHYYPHLELVAGAPLAVNDYVQVSGTSSLVVRRCADGGIGSGTGCPQIATKTSGTIGRIVGGPVRVTADGAGYTWWQIQWLDGSSTVGWSAENWLERTAEPDNPPPVLAPIPNRIVNEGALLTFTNSVVAAPTTDVWITDFEAFANGTPNGTVMFRQPTFSGSTSAFLESPPNTTSVTGTVPAGNDSTRVLRVNWKWNTAPNAWLRLTTANTANLPNPVIDLTRQLKFDMATDRALRVAIGVKETGNPPGTPIGSDGGSGGGIEFVGVTNVVSEQPQPVRTVTAGGWTTLVFDLPNEPVRNFANGNGVLASATGLGVLEHLAFVPADGSGEYTVWLDNFAVSSPRVLTYSLSNAPAGASIHPTTGVFTWTPTEAQGPGVYAITVRVTDNNLPPLSDAQTFQVTVNEVNTPPVLAPVTDRLVHSGATVVVTNTATDADWPANTLTFGLASATAGGASVHPATGVFTWPTSDALAQTTNTFGVFVKDNGVPPLGQTNTFNVVVARRPEMQPVAVNAAQFALQWSAIPGTTYRVQYKTNLEDAGWWTLSPDVTATGWTAALTNHFDAARRFYRVLVLPAP